MSLVTNKRFVWHTPVVEGLSKFIQAIVLFSVQYYHVLIKSSSLDILFADIRMLTSNSIWRWCMDFWGIPNAILTPIDH